MITPELILKSLEKHPNPFIAEGGGVLAREPIDSDHHISIVGGSGLFGDGKTTFEIAIIDNENGELVSLPNGDSIMGHVTLEEVADLMNAVASGCTIKEAFSNVFS